ncbi:MAG: dehydrogenase, short-chain alcohol dehydrogenase like protein [Bradyrhizobium sp.]|nr:dehydrogenase, short-chain alcohol dehydrogenase like protein [Bradyrhizobium sp.]
MRRFEGKIALVTGGHRGLGRETAILFAKEGAKVVVVDIVDAASTVAAIETTGGEAMFVKADVTDAAQVRAMVEKTVDAYGRLDILYNNAAILGNMVPLAEMVEEDFDRTMAVNVRGVFLGMKYGIRQMLKQGGGVIINCGSVSCFVADSDNADYLASKGAVMMLTKGGALEYAQQNIRINAVCPGPMRTSLLEDAAKRMNQTVDEFAKGQNWNLPIGRVADPVEVAKIVLFLASDDASYMVGALVSVDGGYTIV